MKQQPARRRRRTATGATIEDVARAAGVSTATVSRVLAGNYPVSEASRTKVTTAVEELSYSASGYARGLSGGGIGPVGVLLPSITGASFTMLAEGAQHEAAARGRLCLIGTTSRDPAEEWAQFELMRGQRVAALVLLGGARDLEEYRHDMTRYSELLGEHGGRLVLCGRPPLDAAADIIEIGYDHAAATYEMGRHLLELGHRDLLALPGAPDSTTAVARLAGYQRAVAEQPGATLTVHWVDLFERELAREALVAEHRAGTAFTAVVTGNDDMAVGALHALRSLGLRCPEDVSVTGFDGIPVSEDTTPRITTAAVPYAEMGRLAVSLALEGAGEPAPPPATLPVPIRWRESVSAPAGASASR